MVGTTTKFSVEADACYNPNGIYSTGRSQIKYMEFIRDHPGCIYKELQAKFPGSSEGAIRSSVMGLFKRGLVQIKHGARGTYRFFAETADLNRCKQHVINN